MPATKLRDICHARSGDKGATVNIALICYDMRDFDWISRHVTTDVVMKHFGRWVTGPARRYEMPKLGALNFLIDGALDGGVTCALMIDGHGKGFSTILLEAVIDSADTPPSTAGRTGAAA